ncbi:uncharacterized protein LOC113508226 [Trichoplusia ni]|uniref:Uncharacterized protein LOC113508226 n=1 Tax=Trichoplusia ni TaxID=7111 RepID=A0A7E5X2U6_TRINI|nr:uncharacterized protein LOC113508226 [Trichoplusia ni]
MIRSPDSKISKSNPDLCTSIETSTNVTQRKRKQPDCEFTQAIAVLSTELKKNIDDLRADKNNQFTNIIVNINNLREDFNTLSLTSALIQNKVKELRAEYVAIKKDMSQLDTKHDELSQTLTELKSTVNFGSDNYVDCERGLKELERNMNNQAASTVELLERKIDSLEQQAKQCNVEIGNMQERRAAMSNKFKFVWVRNATVLVKESEDSSTFAIRTRYGR